MPKAARLPKHAYAHFHRLLEGLMRGLLAEAVVHWEDPGAKHVFGKEGEENIYERAVYCVESAEPWRTKVRKIAEVQAEILAITGKKNVPYRILTPIFCEGVEEVTLSGYTNYSSRGVSKDQLIAAIRNTEGVDWDAVERASSVVDAIPGETLRTRRPSRDVRVFVTFGSGDVERFSLRKHGLIVVGAKTVYRAKGRRTRADKVAKKPEATVWNYEVHVQAAWDEARRSTPREEGDA